MTLKRITAALLAGALATSVAIADTPVVGSTVVASQGGVSITLEDLDAFAAGIPDDKRAGFFDSPTRIENIITQLLVQRQLAREARELGLEKDPQVERRIELATEEALSKARMQKFKADLVIPDFSQLAQEQFIGRKKDYIIKGRVDVKHVLIALKTRDEDQAKALADTVHAEAVAHPEKFDELIEKYSEDTSKTQNHGLMIDAADKRYVTPFAEAAAALTKKGEISPIVKTDFGYHVLQLVERTPDRQPTFAEVKDQIVAQLRNDYIEKEVKGHGDELRNQRLDANPELIASLRSRYASANRETPAK